MVSCNQAIPQGLPERPDQESLTSGGPSRGIDLIERTIMTTPILYYWAPCSTCSVVVNFANEHGIELDKRDVELEQPYMELLALGGDANLIPYLAVDDQLIQGNDDVIAYLTQAYL